MNRSNWRKTLWTACVLMATAVAAVASPAQTFTVLVNFDLSNGANPVTSLVQGPDGKLYGTTGKGGANGDGTVFKITPEGALSTLYSFCAKTNCTDGEYPNALVLATDGNFYGTTYEGGANGWGTVFKVTLDGTLTTLHSFDLTDDGASPLAGLVQAVSGSFYGTTFLGGASGDGTVFKITPEGTLTVLHSFNGADGGYPYVHLIEGTDGNFYGTTAYGGTNDAGTVFKVTPTGKLTSLHSFQSTDGYESLAPLVQAIDGNFYGTTAFGGAHSYGTVFKITPGGTLATLHHFDGAGGADPYAGLVQATDGNLCGLTNGGGMSNAGTVFKITLGGTLTTLHSFDNTDGNSPHGGLVQDTNGSFYGTAYLGGSNDDGTVFSLTAGLGPFVETLPTSGKVGSTVKILGSNLTGTSSVTFNGTAARFTIVSSTEIDATVPSGATTGNLRLRTPGGTLSSNMAFRVRP